MILYPAILLNSFITFNGFFSGNFRIFYKQIMSPVNRDSFTSSFPTWMPWVELPVKCWTEEEWTFLFCSWPRKESIQSFTNKYDISCGFFIDAFIRLRKFSHIPTEFVECFPEVLDFVRCFLFFYCNDWVGFSSFIISIDLQMLNQSCIPRINPT